MLNRRGLIAGLSIVAAPAIVRASTLMPLRGTPLIDPVKAMTAHAWGGIGGSISSEEAAVLYQRLNEFILGMKKDGLWDKLDHLWIPAENKMVDIKVMDLYE